MAKKSELRFQPAVDLSVIHAAFVVATQGTCNDAKTEAVLKSPTSEINTRLASSAVDIRSFWSALFAEVAAGRPAREACPPALEAAGCSELQVDPTASALASRLDECRIAFGKRFPKLGDQLALRAGPLRDRWQTYGPGLLIEIARQIWGSAPPQDWWPPRVDCLLVQPVRGGDGGFDSGQCRVWMEALLTDVDPQVSEILRLGFWVTQVAVGRHLDAKLGRSDGSAAPPPASSHPEDFGSGTHRRSSLPWRLGCVPVVLSAAAQLELLPGDELPVANAVQRWRLGGEAVADVVAQWWQQWGEADAPMPVALKALQRMLEPLQQPASTTDASAADHQRAPHDQA